MSDEERGVRERAQEKGVEGVIARKYPDLYERVKEVAEVTGESVLDIIYKYAKWALEVQKFSSVLTMEDLKNVSPEALLAAMKMLLFFEQQYFKAIAYANLAQAVQLVQTWQQLFTPYTTGGKEVIPQPPPPSTVERWVNAILRAIELFTMGREEVRRSLAKEVATELAKLAESSEQVKP